MTARRHIPIGSDVELDAEIARVDGGGSVPGANILYGPFTFTFADLKEDGDEATVMTPDAGSWLVNGWIDPATAVDWVSDGSPDMAIEEDPPGPDYDNGIGVFLFDPTIITTSLTTAISVDNNTANLDLAPIVAGLGQRQFNGGPLKVGYVDSGHATATAGSFDLYLVIATPTLPT